MTSTSGKDRMEWSRIVGAAVCLGIGAFGGYRLAGGASDDGHDHDAPVLSDHEIELMEKQKDEEGTVHLDDAAMARLGIELTEVELVPRFQSTVPLHAVVEAPPLRHRTVHAPIGGRVLEVHVETGQAVDATETVITLLREPLPRPALTITANLLTPAQENLHEAVRALRKTALEVEILGAEIVRVKKLEDDAPGDFPVVSPQRLIDLNYEKRRAETALLGAREEAEKHGLNADQVDAVLAGEHGPGFDSSTWRAALSRNGLWTETADGLLAALPADIRDAPWSVATIGELVASGLATDRVLKWLKADSTAADHFLEIGVLLQRGHTLAALKEMHSLGAFEPVVEVRVPKIEGAEAYDIHRLHVQPGAAVSIGDPLVGVHDFRRMRLRIGAVGGEVERLLRASETGRSLRATPLVAGAGPALDDVVVRYVESEGTGYALVQNVLLGSGGGGETAPRYRTWGLREGMRYLVHMPDAGFENVVVLPRNAVVRSGAERVVFAMHGDHLEPRPVRVAFEDASVCVIRPDASIELAPGDRVVTSGAFEVSLAASAGSGDAVDPHAGHSH